MKDIRKMTLTGETKAYGDIGKIMPVVLEQSLGQLKPARLYKFVGGTTSSQLQQTRKAMNAHPHDTGHIRHRESAFQAVVNESGKPLDLRVSEPFSLTRYRGGLRVVSQQMLCQQVPGGFYKEFAHPQRGMKLIPDRRAQLMDKGL